MVTAGANQAYTNVVLTLMDAGDASCLFRPYYFNHLMALQMTGSAKQLVLPPSLPDLQPDVSALRRELEGRAASSDPQLKMVTLVNPGNPSGVMIPRATLEEASALCASHGVWLVIDNTYEHFAYAEGPAHECIEGDHILNVFSFSKAYGMMGWRVGYVAFPPRLGPELFKVQDTIAICPTIASQKLAIGALSAGRDARGGGCRPQPNVPRDVSIGGGVRGDLQYEQGELLCAAPVEAARAQETGWPLLNEANWKGERQSKWAVCK